ncbi:hypothetical protein JOB18_010074 [Solea senegalensis]|uniref:Uncharacterized protein n=1 Tax=Solea senegalensis TaxID=28829 RepID=A0AAV6R6K9_SOLSE|nr:hypothetical protein JOB18_010074 [Solea senegalensis]
MRPAPLCRSAAGSLGITSSASSSPLQPQLTLRSHRRLPRVPLACGSPITEERERRMRSLPSAEVHLSVCDVLS